MLPDGLARVLTADEFFEARVNLEKEQMNEIKAKETRKDSWAAWKEAKEVWQQSENAHIALRDQELAQFFHNFHFYPEYQSFHFSLGFISILSILSFLL